MDEGRCAECGKARPKTEMIRYGEAWICGDCKEGFVQRLQEGVSIGASQIWRSGKKLVARKGMVLPERCVKCNAPTEGPGLVRKLFWHSPLVYLLVFLNLLIYLVVALIVRKKATVTIGLCDHHRRLRRNAIITAWSIFGGSLALFVGAGFIGNGWLVFAGFVALVVSLIYALVFARTVYATRIDKEYVWLGGVGPEYLAGLPEWMGKK